MKTSPTGFVLLIALFFLSAIATMAQINLNTLNSTVIENFDTLPSTGSDIVFVDNVTLLGGYTTRGFITAGTGSATGGTMYSFGSTSSTERALGSVCSNTTGNQLYGVRFKNNTGFTITSLDISYNGEEWRKSGETVAQSLLFDFRQAATVADLTTGSYTAVSALNFASPVFTAGGASLNGNLTANRTALSSTIFVVIPPGGEIMLRWTDPNDANSDHGLAIDDLNVTPRGNAAFVVNDLGDSTDATPGDGVCETSLGNAICTLRAAIDEAEAFAGNETISFASPLFDTPQTIEIVAGLPVITTTMSIVAGGGRVTVSGDQTDVILNVSGTGNLTMTNLAVRDGLGLTGGGLSIDFGGTANLTNTQFTGNEGLVNGGAISNNGTLVVNTSLIQTNTAGERGAGIHNGSTGILTVNDTTISFNGTATDVIVGGGGISNDGTLTVNRSLIYGNITAANGGGVYIDTGTANFNNTTIAFNSAFAANGGGIYNDLGGTLNVTHCTIADQNFAGIAGGGIYNLDIANVHSTIIAGNGGNVTSPDVFGTFASPTFDLVGISDGSTGFTPGGENIVGTSGSPVDPQLNPIGDNGGPTQTYTLKNSPLSPAIDKGKAFVSTLDQRGFSRTFDDPAITNAVGGDGTDIGAVERLAPTPASVSVSGRVVTSSGLGIRNALVRIDGGFEASRTAVTNAFGFYTFDDLTAGNPYTVSVSAKRYGFAEPARAFVVNASLANVDFVAAQR